MFTSSLRSKAALTALATTAALAAPAAGLALPGASAAPGIGARHVTVPSKFAPSQLVAIPHSSAVAVFGYSETTTRRAGLEVPSGSHYVLRSFGKTLYPARIVAASASSFWAVASTSKGRYDVLRLSGKTWTAVKLPAAAAAASFDSISASSPSNVWVSGYLSNPDGSGQEVLHWNGKTWSVVSLGDTTDSTVTSIATSSSSNVWAIDGDDVLHFNGTTWSHVDNEELGAIISLGTTSSSNAWFLGGNGGDPTLTHWTGAKFQAVKLPNPKQTDVQSLSVAGTSAWVAGYTETTKGATHQVVLRSTGSTVKSVHTPSYHAATAASVVAFSTSSAVVAVSEMTGNSCSNYHAVPILLTVSASATRSIAKGTSYRTGCG